MYDKILECPDCGERHLYIGRVEFSPQDSGFIREFKIPNDGFLYQVECKCGFMGAPMYSIEDAISAWNEDR